MSEGQWEVNYHTRKMPQDSLRVTTPGGFHIDMFFPTEVCDLLMALSIEDTTIQVGANRFSIKDRKLWLIDADSWVNKGFRYGDEICNVQRLAYILGTEVLKALHNYERRQRA